MSPKIARLQNIECEELYKQRFQGERGDTVRPPLSIWEEQIEFLLGKPKGIGPLQQRITHDKVS